MIESYDEMWERMYANQFDEPDFQGVRPQTPEIPGWRQPNEPTERGPQLDTGVRSEMEPYQRLEAELAAWAGYQPKQVVVCSTGSAALHLALEALQLPRGSEVIVPDFTFIACARAVTLAGLTPVFVDCLDTLNMSCKLVGSALPGAAVVMAVHVYGRKSQVPEFLSEAVPNQVRVIEDLAEAHGVKPHPMTDAACWSFYKNKIVAGEEGGAVAFRDVKHAALARALRSQGYTEEAWVHLPRAMNYRMTNDAAARVSRSLTVLNWALHSRRQIEAWYNTFCPLETWKMPRRDAPWVYDLRIWGLTAERQGKIVAALRAEGIEARHGFKPLSCQEEYRCQGYRAVGCTTGTSMSHRASREVICLPIQPGVTTEDSCRRAFAIIRALSEV